MLTADRLTDWLTLSERNTNRPCRKAATAAIGKLKEKEEQNNTSDDEEYEQEANTNNNWMEYTKELECIRLVLLMELSSLF